MLSTVQCLLSILVSLASLGSTQRIPNPPFPNFVQLDPLNDLAGESNRRQTPRSKSSSDQRNTEDYANFYQLKIFKHYELNVTNWEEIWVDFDEHPVSMQNRLIDELRFKQKTIEKMLISFCEDRCIQEACAMSLERENLEIRPKNPERWARYFGLEWSDIPLKVKRLVIMQLR